MAMAAYRRHGRQRRGVICAAGGGAPVIRDTHAGLHGIEAVIDKDLTAALLAAAVSADMLLLLTDAAAVMDGYRTSHVRPIRHATPAQLRTRPFPAGSMAPKMAAVCRLTETTGRPAAIGRPDDAALLDGTAGTIVTP
jgi:carbamate kinase